MPTHSLHLEASTAGLLISLANTLPERAQALRRRAIALARRLNRPHDRATDNRAADTLALLLTAADNSEFAGYAEDGLLDQEFDA
jgi:hypothetical protein